MHESKAQRLPSPENLRRVSPALGVGYLPATRTPWVALSAVNNEDPTESTSKTKQNLPSPERVPKKKKSGETRNKMYRVDMDKQRGFESHPLVQKLADRDKQVNDSHSHPRAHSHPPVFFCHTSLRRAQAILVEFARERGDTSASRELRAFAVFPMSDVVLM